MGPRTGASPGQAGKAGALAILLALPYTGIGASSNNAEAATIRLVAAANTADTAVSEVILGKAYARLGYRLEVARYPAERALRLADAGRADGDVQRIDGLASHYPNLLQLKPAINYIEGSAFTADRAISIEGWESLRPYRIGFIRGIKFAELNTVGMDRHPVGDYQALFKMLIKGRFDLGVSPRLNGLYQLKQLGLEGVTPLDPPLARFDLYHYLHRSHAQLAPKLEAVFREMQASGELTAIREAVVSRLLGHSEQGLPACGGDDTCVESAGGEPDAIPTRPRP